jgi:hypothetical protein
MAASRVLPARPSLESLRKQAKKLTRDLQRPVSLRDAQLLIAREYGFAGWRDLVAEVMRRTGKGLDVAGAEAERAVHDNDVERLQKLLAQHPALLSWRNDAGESLLTAAATSFGDSGDEFREQRFTRKACAELLIDAGAVVEPSIWQNVLNARAKGMLELLWKKGVLPRTLTVLAALGDHDAVRASLAGSAPDQAAINDAFMCACGFKHKEIAALLLERCIAIDPDLGRRIDAWQGRAAFIDYFGERAERYGAPWHTLVVNELRQSIVNDDLPAFRRWLEAEPYLLGESSVDVQVGLIELATYTNRERFIVDLLDRAPALLQQSTPPPSSALVHAFEYGNDHLVPLLTRLWPLPDDLPHAAGMGDLAAVARWFDADGQPALGELNRHYPAHDSPGRANLRWGPPKVQHVLDVAFAWACVNHHFAVASFLLEHGADINTDWSTHEPAGILHECAIHGNYETAKFLIDRGIDMTIRDYRWGGTAAGWAYYAAGDKKMTSFLTAAETERRKQQR